MSAFFDKWLKNEQSELKNLYFYDSPDLQADGYLSA